MVWRTRHVSGAIQTHARGCIRIVAGQIPYGRVLNNVVCLSLPRTS
jgi:hypothetical protein